MMSDWNASELYLKQQKIKPFQDYIINSLTMVKYLVILLFPTTWVNIKREEWINYEDNKSN